METLIAHNVRVVFERGRGANYYEENYAGKHIKRTLHVNYTSPDWRTAFVHEYMHFRQSQEGLYHFGAGNLSSPDPYQWASGDLSLTEEWAIAAVLECEQDCEERTRAVVRGVWGDHAATLYCRKASLYLTFWYHIRNFSRWPAAGKFPYNNARLLRLMPTALPRPVTTPAALKALKNAMRTTR
jgi:hypothetical protein